MRKSVPHQSQKLRPLEDCSFEALEARQPSQATFSLSIQLTGNRERNEFHQENLLTGLPASSHMNFNEVGALAGAVSYNHIPINVDFTSILTACRQVRTALKNYDD